MGGGRKRLMFSKLYGRNRFAHSVKATRLARPTRCWRSARRVVKQTARGGGCGVVPNKYPALEAASTLTPTLSQREREMGASTLPSAAGEASVNAVAALGLHEIVVESPRHLESITGLNDAEVAEVFEVYRQRLEMLRQSKQYRSAMVFKNGGPTAGATLVHLHSQIMAFQMGTPVTDDRLSRFQDFTRQHGECPLCQMVSLSQAGSDERAVVATTTNFVAFCPFASRFAYEMWIAPRSHAAHFDSMTAESFANWAACCDRCSLNSSGSLKFLLTITPCRPHPLTHSIRTSITGI